MRCNRSISVAAFFVFLSARSALACEFAISPLIFGEYIPMDKLAAKSMANVEVTCPIGVRYRVSALEGQGGGTILTRHMMQSGGGDMLSYNLYLTPAGRMIWGDGTLGTSVIDGVGNAHGRTHFVYGIIAPDQHVAGGTYGDTVQVVIEF